MSRPCIISKIVDNIGEEIGVNRTSAHFVEGKPNTILLPIGGLNGDNKRLDSKDNTYNWAKTLKSKIDKKFLASKYGSLIQIDNTSSSKGTLLHIMMQTKLVDAYEARNNSLNNAAQITSIEKSPTEKVDSILSEFATKNNIKIEFVNELKDKFGSNILGLYNSLDGIIKVAKNERREDTLSEEIVHSITSGLGGRSNTLVNALYTGVNKLDYKSMIPEYIELYEGNEEMLIKEAADKMIAKQVLNGIKNPFSNLISRIVNKFLSLFKGTEIGQLAELKLLADELATPIVNIEKLDLVVSDLPSDKIFYQVADKSKKDKQVSKTLEQELFFRRRLITLKKSIESLKDKDKIKKLNEEYTFIESKLLDLEETKNTQLLVDIGTNLLDSAQKYIEGLELGTKKNTKDDDFIYTIETLGVLDKLKGVSDRSKDLKARFQPFIESKIVEEVNKYWTGGEVTLEDIKGQTEDINRPRKWFGALSDVNNYLASTIGSIITATHNKISSFNKELSSKIKEEVDLVKKWADKNGVSHKDLYKPFIQKMYGTTVLTKQYTSEFYDLMRKNYKDKNSDDLDTSLKAKNWLSSNVWRSEDGNYHATKKEFLNNNYEKIMNTLELKRFYDFYQKTIQESAEKLPIKLHEDFIPNIRDKSFIDIFKSDKTITGKLKEGINDLMGLRIHEFRDTDFVGNEELFSDVIPLQYLDKVKAEEKSEDLGESLFKFASFANSHDIMSEVLPKTRLLQEQIKNQRFTKSSNPNISILGLESNINEMVDKTIAMQLKDQKKKDELKIPTGKIFDEDGKEIGNKYIHGSRIIDFGLKYNSLLRIGLNPFNAISNVLFGDISNIIEGSGGRHYTLTNLHKATEIYFSQNFNKNSKMNKIFEKINPFEENEDYGLTKGLSIKTNLTGEKIKDAMYFPQRAGENFIQRRLALAVMLKSGLWEKFDDNGNLKKEFEGTVDNDKVAAYINNVITKNHGRYSEKEAAIMQQNVLYRMAIQFKKWIPAAIESRLAGKQFNNKLGVETEGRYITAYKLIFKDLKNTITRLQNGELTELEIYNMKKNLTELVIALAAILMYIGLGFNDDDKRKKNPYYKFCMDQLDRVSGDLLFFYDPVSMTKTLKNPIPLIKTSQDLLSTMKALPYAFYGAIPGYKKYEYKSGPNKGRNKFYSKAQGLTPGIKPFKDVINLFNEEKFVDYSSLP